MTDWLLMLMSLVLTAFSSGTETAFSAASRIRALARAREGDPRAARSVRFMKDPERYLTTTLVGTNIGTVLCSSLAAGLAEATGRHWIETASAVAVGLVILVFAEVIPKHAAFIHRDSLVDRAALPLSMIRTVLYPVVLVAGWLPRLLMGRGGSSRFFESREEVRSYLHSEGAEAGRDADRVLDLGSSPAEMHMKGYEDYPSIPSDISREEATRVALSMDAGFLLVFEPGGRNLAGIVRTSLLLRQTGDWDLPGIIEGIPSFDRSTVIGKVLYDLRRSGAPAGVVLGSSGQPAGMIDPDLIVEAILGRAVCTRPEPLGRLQ